MTFLDFLKEEKEQPYNNHDGGERCDICKTKVVAAMHVDETDVKENIVKYPLNKRHTNTYRRRFEFMVSNNLWKLATMKDGQKYMCLECFEREYLTPLIKDKQFLNQIKDKNIDKPKLVKFIDTLLSRKPNKYGIYQLDFTMDLDGGNPVNENLPETLALAKKLNKKFEVDAKTRDQEKRDRAMIGNYDYENNVA